MRHKCKMDGYYTNYNPFSESLYRRKDIVRKNLLWDTETLFSIVPETKESSSVPANPQITSFKFKSAAYKEKTETWVFAAIGMPNATNFPRPAQGYPALLLIHGGAMCVNYDWIKYWTDKGFVALAYDLFSNQTDGSGNRIVNPEGGPTENDGVLHDTIPMTQKILGCITALRTQFCVITCCVAIKT